MSVIEESVQPSILSALNRLLKEPAAVASAAGERRLGALFAAAALCCYALYGLAAGFFQGEGQIMVAALKAPAIVLGTALLCLPSLYVFTALAGAETSLKRTAILLSGFCGVLGLVMLGMIPIVWLFSVSSRSLAFIFWMHVLMWLASIVFARHFLRHAFESVAQRRVLRLWLLLFVVVSFQMTTHLRPVLRREPPERVFAAERMSFLEHLRLVNRTH